MARRALLTGCSGYLGGVLARALLARPDVERVLGVDIAPPRELADRRFRFVRGDVRDAFLLRSLLDEERIETVFHLAFRMGEPRDEPAARAVNVGGTLAVLEASSKCPALRRLVLSASASAYGARRGNPEFLREEDPLRADTLTYGVHKRLVEEELQRALPGARRDLEVVVLRICNIVGSGERGDGPIKAFCELPAGVSVMFHRGGLQFVTEDDLMRVFMKVMEAPSLRGTFNVAPDDYTTIAEICRAIGKPRIPVPYFLLWLAFFLARRLSPKAEVTEKLVSYLAYPCVISNHKLKAALGLSFTKRSLEAFIDCARGLGAAPAAPASPAALTTAAPKS